MDVSDNTYRNIENNKNSPNINILEKIASIFRISLDTLLEKSDGEFKCHSKKCAEFCAFMYVPEKAIINYENLLREKREYISLLKVKIDQLENIIKQSSTDKN